ncbi:NAD(P)/FAD-dependent oxidoreductase [Nocardia pseudovaccinii]|uniref:NAD(P)/FAD-dependent oxidoreductase n=1 Tax=Nocardia pseudovaccinii TaxID=189540 RepID=UPI001C3FE087|nr:FAD-dependent oxidoreductase [Nocardia pseudovaccinii]
MGASQAGCATAAALRRFGFDGQITMIGDEPHPPYSRPPLSKGVLTGSETADSVFLSSNEDIELLTGVAAVGLDRDSSRVRLDDGETIGYDGLVIATGASARRLSGKPSQEITLRTLDDAVYLRQSLDTISSVVVAGGGFLGMEIASSAVSLGKSVTVVDQNTPLAGRLGPLLSDLCLTAAADKGVKVLVSRAGVEIADDAPGQLQASDGTILAEADIVVTAVGDIPNTGWLRDSGLPLAGGVIIDDACQAAPGIVAAGDVVSLPGPGGRWVRSPHWSNALSQATIAAATLLGRQPDTQLGSAPSFFWTEVFGMRIRLAGQLPPVGEPTVLDGSIEERRALLMWPSPDPENAFGTVAAVNYPISAPKLTKLARHPHKH